MPGCPQQRKFPASLLFDRSQQNFADKRAAFTSMPKDKLVIVPVSEWIRNEMQSSFLKDYPFRVIHNGINTEFFNLFDTQAVKEKYQLQGKHILLGVASIWSKEKGLDDFIQMASLLKENEQIVLVGVDEKTQKQLPANIRSIRRTENVRQLAELYAAADAFINPTWQDNYHVNMESIACGTPVVTYRTGGSIEAVTRQTGFVVEQGDVKGTVGSSQKHHPTGKRLLPATLPQLCYDPLPQGRPLCRLSATLR